MNRIVVTVSSSDVGCFQLYRDPPLWSPPSCHLAQAGFTGTPALVGSLSDAAGLRALVTEYLPGARDGWEWCVDDLLAGHVAFAASLGALAARLHVALATPTAVLPSPVTPPVFDDDRARCKAV